MVAKRSGVILLRENRSTGLPGLLLNVGTMQHDSEDAALIQFAFHFDTAFEIIDDAVANRESQTRSLAFAFAGEEGIEYFLDMLGRYANAGVYDFSP